MSKQKEYWASLDEENYIIGPYKTKKEAYEEAFDESNHEGEDVTVYVGESTKFDPSIDINSIIDQVSERAYEEIGEHAEGYLHDLTQDHKDEFGNMINTIWLSFLMVNNEMPLFFTIDNPEEVRLDGQTGYIYVDGTMVN